jgi:hypothetical protein
MAMSDSGSPARANTAMAALASEHSDVAQQHSGHRAPAQERCCESMSSCSVATLAGVTERGSTPILSSTPPAHSDAMLASVDAAPEPPPPKA